MDTSGPDNSPPDEIDPWRRPWPSRLAFLFTDCLVPLVCLAGIGAWAAVRSLLGRAFQRPGSESSWTWSWPARAAFLFPGVIVPIGCFIFAAPQGTHFTQAWQSDTLESYVGLLTRWRPASPFYPHLFYSMTCLTLLLINPGRFSKSLLVRIGIYAGVLLALQYFLIVLVLLSTPDGWTDLIISVMFWTVFGMGAVAIPWGIGWVVVMVVRGFGLARVLLVLASIALIVVTLVFLTNLVDNRPSRAMGEALGVFVVPLAFVCFASLWCGTPWAVAAYSAMALYLMRHAGGARFQISLRGMLGTFTWLSAYLGSWRVSLVLMLEEYARLPTEPSGCYVCTAAARGHRKLVGADDEITISGETLRVNDQMRRLKCAELVWKHMAPRSHNACRRVYDRLGPPLAAALVHPLLADAAYLSLKPAEWFARAALAILLPGRGELIRNVYAKRA